MIAWFRKFWFEVLGVAVIVVLGWKFSDPVIGIGFGIFFAVLLCCANDGENERGSDGKRNAQGSDT